MKIKKLLSAAMAMAIGASLIVIPETTVSASGFSSANYTRRTHPTDVGSDTSSYYIGGTNSQFTVTTGTDSSGRTNYLKAVSKKDPSSSDRILMRYVVSGGDAGGQTTAKYAHARMWVAAEATVEGNALSKRLDMRFGTEENEYKSGVEYTYYYITNTWHDDNFGTSSQEGYGLYNMQFNSYSHDNSSSGSKYVFNTSTTSNPVFNRVDVIWDLSKGYVYVYSNGQFGSKRDKGPTDGKFYGYRWAGQASKAYKTGDTFEWKLDDELPGHTVFYNSDDYTVTLEDVINFAGVSETLDGSDPDLAMYTRNILDYVPGKDYRVYNQVRISSSSGSEKNYLNVTYTPEYEGDVSGKGGTLTIPYVYNTSGDKEQAMVYMLEGYFRKDNTNIQKPLTHISFNQKIDEDDGGEFVLKLRNNTKNIDMIKFQNDNGKMKTTVANSTYSSNSVTWDKSFNDSVRVDLVLRKCGAAYDSSITSGSNTYVYVYIDGKYFATVNTKTSWYTPCGLYLYTLGNSTVSISDWEMKCYNSTKDARILLRDMLGIDSAEGNIIYKTTDPSNFAADSSSLSANVDGSAITIQKSGLDSSMTGVASLLGKAYIDGIDALEGLTHFSFTHKQNNANTTEYRMRDLSGSNRTLLTVKAGANKEMIISVTGDTSATLEKDITDAVNLDIYFDATTGKAAVYADGELVSAKGGVNATEFCDVRIYSASEADITLSNWEMTVYDDSVTLDNFDDVVDTNPVYWKGGKYENKIEFNEDRSKFSFVVTPASSKSTDPEDAKVLVGIYDEDGKLMYFYTYDYISGYGIGDEIQAPTIDTVKKGTSQTASTIKAMVWNTKLLLPYAKSNILDLAEF